MQHEKVNPILNGGRGGGGANSRPKLYFNIAQKLLGVGS